jgi:HAE1 family hydrophobic/amphiphilic exporter-1
MHFGRPSGTVADDVVAYLKNNPLPDGIQMTWGSDIKRQNDSFGALGSVLLISFLLIYLIMVALYDSYIYPFVALFAIPVAAIGAFLALNLSLSNLSLFALLGLIMLMGLVTKNSILIVDFTNQLKAEGKHYKEALITAGKERMRPILMTTLINGNRNVAHSISQRNSSRMEKRIGVGNYWWFAFFIGIDGLFSANGVLWSG